MSASSSNSNPEIHSRALEIRQTHTYPGFHRRKLFCHPVCSLQQTNDMSTQGKCEHVLSTDTHTCTGGSSSHERFPTSKASPRRTLQQPSKLISRRRRKSGKTVTVHSRKKTQIPPPPRSSSYRQSSREWLPGWTLSPLPRPSPVGGSSSSSNSSSNSNSVASAARTGSTSARRRRRLPFRRRRPRRRRETPPGCIPSPNRRRPPPLCPGLKIRSRPNLRKLAKLD